MWAAQPTDRKYYSHLHVCLSDWLLPRPALSSLLWFSSHPLAVCLSAVLLHPSERGRYRQQSEGAESDGGAEAGGRGGEEQGGLLGGVWRKNWPGLRSVSRHCFSPWLFICGVRNHTVVLTWQKVNDASGILLTEWLKCPSALYIKTDVLTVQLGSRL